MTKTRRERCPQCGFLDVIKWGTRAGHQRYKCCSCGSLFTFRRKDISAKNRFVWFKWWVLGKQTLYQISQMSGYSERQLRRWFEEYLDSPPTWIIQRRKSVNLLIDGTWFRNGLCLVLYRDNTTKSTVYYRLTDGESELEISSDLIELREMGIKVKSVTSDGSENIIRAVRFSFPRALRQRCLAHIERECLQWLTQHPRTSAGLLLRRLVCQISYITTNNDRLDWVKRFYKWHEEYEDFLEERSVNPETGEERYTHESVRRAYVHIKNALPEMFTFIDHPDIPKTSNAIEGFFGHLKDSLRLHRGLSYEHFCKFVKWYLYFNLHVSKRRVKK